MPEHDEPVTDAGPRAGKPTAARTTRRRPASPADGPTPPPAPKSRTRTRSRAKAVAVADPDSVAAPAAVVLAPTPEEALLTAGIAHQTEESLDAVRARRDELLGSIADAERRLAELRRQAQDVEELGALRHQVEAARQDVEIVREEAEEVRREAADATAKYQAAGELVAAARADAEAIRQTVEEARAAAESTREQAEMTRAEADRARGEFAHVEQGLDGLWERLRAARRELDTLDAAARETLDRVRAVTAETRTVTPPPLPTVTGPGAVRPQPAAVVEGPVLVPDALPEVSAVPAEELAPDARQRLLEYLSDARAVEKEQVDLLQTLADSTPDPEARSLLEAHREVSRRHRAALEARVAALGGEPASVRGLLGQIVTRLWDAIQKPRGERDATVHTLLKAAAAAGFAAELYLAVHALARAVGDGETATLAATHHRGGRVFADRLRARLVASAAAMVRR